MSRAASPLRRPVTLSRAQIRMIYGRLEEPSAPRESPLALVACLLLLFAGLLLAIWLKP